MSPARDPKQSVRIVSHGNYLGDPAWTSGSIREASGGIRETPGFREAGGSSGGKVVETLLPTPRSPRARTRCPCSPPCHRPPSPPALCPSLRSQPSPTHHRHLLHSKKKCIQFGVSLHVFPLAAFLDSRLSSLRSTLHITNTYLQHTNLQTRVHTGHGQGGVSSGG